MTEPDALALKSVGHLCDECWHVFIDTDLKAENPNEWGHPCFGVFKGNKRHPGTARCESYRAEIFRMVKP